MASTGHTVFITTDQNLQHQQNLARLTFGVVILTSTSWPRIQKHIPAVLAAVGLVKPGKCLIVQIG